MKVLVCGSRMKKDYSAQVDEHLTQFLIDWDNLQPRNHRQVFTVIEGCCPDSADVYAERWAERKKQYYPVEVMHFPSTSGNYLRRNIEMVIACDRVIGFWNGMSYGTAQTLAQAVMRGKPVKIVKIKEEKPT